MQRPPLGAAAARSWDSGRERRRDPADLAHASDLLSRIVVDPRVCFRKPAIRGHRIWVSLILGHLAEGWTVEAIVEEFDGIDTDDVRACIAYRAQLADVRFSDLDDVA